MVAGHLPMYFVPCMRHSDLVSVDVPIDKRVSKKAGQFQRVFLKANRQAELVASTLLVKKPSVTL
jgi:hypothetical protein